MARRTSKRLLGLALLSATGLSSCISHSYVTDYHGVNGIRGVPIEYQTTTKWALYGLFIFPLIGNVNKDVVVEDFLREAAARGASRHRISQTSSTTYWFLLPPLSFFIHPVQTVIEGDIEVE